MDLLPPLGAQVLWAEAIIVPNAVKVALGEGVECGFRFGN